MASTSSKFNGKDISQERLKEVLEYDPATGHFRWKARLSNRVNVGDIAGTDAPNGYRYIRFDGYMLLAHRLVWLYVCGEWPKFSIDHINGNRSDNRFVNLREASASQNAINGSLRSTNKSGYRGVSWDKAKNKWVSKIVVNGKQKMLGRFSSKEDAYLAYCEAAKTLHGEFSRVE